MIVAAGMRTLMSTYERLGLCIFRRKTKKMRHMRGEKRKKCLLLARVGVFSSMFFADLRFPICTLTLYVTLMFPAKEKQKIRMN